MRNDPQAESNTELRTESNRMARETWEEKAVGSQRATSEKGTPEYFQQIRNYRYGYETPFIPYVFGFSDLKNKEILEVGVGNGIDAVEMVRHGAVYSGIDITRNHLELALRNLCQSFPGQCDQFGKSFYEGDLLEMPYAKKFDVVYSFGVLHHIEHEYSYLLKIKKLLKENGELRIAVYSKYSFFNAWLLFTWLTRNKMKNSFDDWRSHVAEGSQLGNPVVIKIRSKKDVKDLLEKAGFHVISYKKKGFVQNYIPIFGRLCHPQGMILESMASLLGWYHCFIAVPRKSRA